MNDVFLGATIKKGSIEEMKGRNVLLDGEELKAAIWGSIESSRIPLDATRSKNMTLDLGTKVMGLDKRNGILGLTTKRVIFYMPKMMNRYEFEAYQTGQIDSIQFTKGMRKGRIDISIINNNRVIKGIDNEEGKTIVDMIQNVLYQDKKNEGATMGSNQDPIDALKMKYVNGEITEKEYEKKKKILEG